MMINHDPHTDKMNHEFLDEHAFLQENGYMSREEKILSAKICPYCNKAPKLVDSSVIYGRSYGLIWLCKECDAYVGVHKGTDVPLGRLADKPLREAKKSAHKYFDVLWKKGLISHIDQSEEENNYRNRAYAWLAKELKIDPEYCHIGMMDEDMCMRVVAISKNALIKQGIVIH